MQSGRYFNNGPGWNQNQNRRMQPPNGVNYFHPQQNVPFSNNNNMNMNHQQFVMPMMLSPNGMMVPVPSMQQRRQFVNSTPFSPHYQQSHPPKRRNPSVDQSYTNNKRARVSGGSSEYDDESSNSSRDKSALEKFVVPISRGTEKITIAIWDYFLSSQMSDGDLKKKLLLRKNLLSIFEEAFTNCRLFIVGSSMTGFATKNSDIDMCLLISDDDVHQKRDAIVVLMAITKALRHCSFIHAPQVIRAKVPILKFKDRISNFECDLNINNTIGVRNTHLLRYYAYMDWRVRPLMLFIKHWARFHDINDASKKTISSYSFSLMLIHFLQVGVKPAVLPCLQKMKPDLFSGRCDVRSLSLCIEKIDFKSPNTATLGELFLGFLNYYSNVFRYDSDLISVRTGKKLRKDDAMGDPTQWKSICIEEPFECSNTARSVYDLFVFKRIHRVFMASHQRLSQQRDCAAILSRPF